MSLILHANCIARGARGLLITGRSGSGKSSLSLELIALGCQLVADDRTELRAQSSTLFAAPVAPLQGLIEARFLGILRLPFAPETEICAVLDLDQIETERLPQRHTSEYLGITLPKLHNCASRYFASAIFAYLEGEIADI